MSNTFELETEGGSLTVGRYAGSAEDRDGSHRRYNLTDCYGGTAQDLTKADLAALAHWIVRELETPHAG